MRYRLRIGMGVIGLMMLAGCRTATKITEVPRVDLELEGGNRGYLIGTPPPPSSQLNTTRQIIRTDVEVPSLYKPKHGNVSAVLEPGAPAEGATVEEPAGPSEAAATGTYDIYTVKPGESLWTIAAKPEVYGKAIRWRRLYEANRDQLKNPNSVRAGMKLKIPRRGGPNAHTTTESEDEGVRFKK